MLLFDENLAAQLVADPAVLYPSCTHFADEGLASASDRAIRQHARDHGFIFVSKDVDFQRFSVLHGAPPKVVWIGLETARPQTSSAC